MAKILATETACLNSFGLGSNPANVNDTQRLYFGNTLAGGDLHIVDDEFNILFTLVGIAGAAGTEVFPADLVCIGDFGYNSLASAPNSQFGLYFYDRAIGGAGNDGLIVANSAFSVLFTYTFTAAVAPLAAIDDAAICIIQDFGVNSNVADTNAINSLYYQEVTAGGVTTTRMVLVNSAYEIVSTAIIV